VLLAVANIAEAQQAGRMKKIGVLQQYASITPKWVSSLALGSRILSWDRFSHRACSLASCAELATVRGPSPREM